ncbi:MAG: hypothetical protein AAGA65_19335 [Actinomycetota bacterium]
MASGTDRRLAGATALVAVLAFLAAAAGLDARATYGARVSADEPQYLITAISIGEDFSLDVSDELAEERFLPFHEIGLNTQTIDLNDEGRRVSPHDPLLPLLLAIPMRIGGWAGAKLALAVIGAAVAALTLRLAVNRLEAPLLPATVVVGGFAVAPPFSAYGIQVYPAMPAALCVLIGALAITSDRPAPAVPAGASPGGVRGLFRDVDAVTAVVLLAVVALPWLSVKYVPVASVLAIAGLWRSWAASPGADRIQRLPRGTLLIYGLAGVSYLALHRLWYNGWTVYAAGDHFVNGEFLVVGFRPDYVGRSRRLVGLLVDRQFGLIAWTPAFLALAPSLVVLARSRRPGRFVLLGMFAAGWATATWIALTMHGWWWPGRQVVPVLPIAVAATAAFVGTSRRLLAGVFTGCLLGAGTWLYLAWEASTDRRTLIVDFAETNNPWFQLWREVLPDHQRMDPIDVVLTVIWTLLLLGLCYLAVRRDAAARSGAPVAGSGGEPGAGDLEDGAVGDGPGEAGLGGENQEGRANGDQSAGLDGPSETAAGSTVG